VTSAHDAALAYLSEFLVKRRLLIFDGATGAVDGVVDGIVEFAQILYGHFRRDENTEANTVVNHGNINFRCRIKLTVGTAWLMPASKISAKSAAA
jgi:hypothetical protein